MKEDLTIARDCLADELHRLEATILSNGGSKFQDSCQFIDLVCAQRIELLRACEAAATWIGATVYKFRDDMLYDDLYEWNELARQLRAAIANAKETKP